MRTLVELLEGSVNRFPDLPALSFFAGKNERWSWTYGELWENARRAATLLRNAGVEKGERVVLWGPNRPEWVAAFFGAQMLGAAVVPLDLRSPEDLLTRIEEQTQPKYMFIGKEQAGRLTGAHANWTLLDDLRNVLPGLAPLAIDPARVPAPNDIAELVFTSGTTGNPKGVILTHANVIVNTRMSQYAIQPSPRNRVLSILPLSHMFEQQGGLFVPMAGGSSITYVGSLRPDVIFDAMRAARITNMSVVPQVLELFRDGIEREVRKQGKTRQFDLLLRAARYLPMPARRLLFRQVHGRMGGALEFLVSGGAYLDPKLAGWWELLGVKIIQGYGMTEAAPVVAAHTLTDREHHSVGRPLPGISLRVAEDGELLVRGENVTPGYWQNPEATADAFEEGWYRTGDLGSLDAAGRLHLRGRKKNIIVLANGMNVYPEDVENALRERAGVKDAVVLGLPRGQDVEVHAVLLLEKDASAPAQIVRAANATLSPHQRIGGTTVWPEESFPLTPTLKAKRMDIFDRVVELEQAPAGGSRT